MSIAISPGKFIRETRSQIKKTKRTNILAFLLFFLLAIPVVYYLGTNYSLGLFHRNELREGMIGQPRFLNPLFSQENEIDRTIVKLVFQSLVKYDFEEKQFVGDIAEKFEIEEDGKVYRFWIKDNIFFHDGQKLTIDDVLFTYQIIQHDNYHGYWRGAFSNVQIEKLNSTEFKITLEEPLASFLEHNTVGIIPQHHFENIDDALRPDHIFNVSPTGSGQFAYDKKELYTGDTSKILNLTLKNQNKNSQVKQIRFQFYDNEENLLNAYKMGEIHSFGTLNSQFKKLLSEWNNYQLEIQTLQQRYYALFFNLSSDKKINTPETREAFCYALDKEKMTSDVFPNESIKIMQGPLESTSWAFNPEVKKFEYDLEQAREVFTNLSEEERNFIFTYPTSTINEKTAIFIKESWEKAGLNIILRPIAIHQLRDQVVGPRNFEILLLGQETSIDPDRYAFWHSTQKDYPLLNITQIEDRFIDRALEQGRKKTDQNERKEAYFDFQRYFQNEIPSYMLYQPNYYYFVSNRFANKIQIDNLGIPEDRFHSLLQ